MGNLSTVAIVANKRNLRFVTFSGNYSKLNTAMIRFCHGHVGNNNIFALVPPCPDAPTSVSFTPLPLYLITGSVERIRHIQDAVWLRYYG